MLFVVVFRLLCFPVLFAVLFLFYLLRLTLSVFGLSSLLFVSTPLACPFFFSSLCGPCLFSIHVDARRPHFGIHYMWSHEGVLF